MLPERMPQTFLVGLALGWMTLATGSLLPAVVAHAAHNATPVALIALARADELAAIESAASGLPPGAVAGGLAGFRNCNRSILLYDLRLILFRDLACYIDLFLRSIHIDGNDLSCLFCRNTCVRQDL
jgi:hypothetical protein